jgi:hypothetical protein
MIEIHPRSGTVRADLGADITDLTDTILAVCNGLSLFLDPPEISSSLF